MLNRLGMAAGFLVLLLLYAIPLQTVVLASATWSDVRSLESALAGEGLPTKTARAVGRDVQLWRGQLSFLIQAAPQFGWLPIVGADLTQASKFDALAAEIPAALEPTLQVYEAFEAQAVREPQFGKALVALAEQDADQLAAARAALASLREQRAAIQEPGLSTQAHAFLTGLDRNLAEWDSALRLVKHAPQLLGADTPRRYLVLAQNNDELRPTGGFISAVGVLRVERGDISVEWFGDSFAADDLDLIHPPPPAPLQKYMWASQWLLRDSNWYANFPTSAAVAQSMYARDRGVQTDGVIAVDMRFLPHIVGALENVEWEGERLAPEDVIQRLKESWKPVPAGDMSAGWFESDRKNFLAELFQEMMARVRGGDVRANALMSALLQGLREKSLQIYLNDDEAQEAILDAGWGGAVQPGAGDFLAVVDSNVGFNKVNARVWRDILYSVQLDAQGGTAAVEITYSNPAPVAEGSCDLLAQDKDETYASMEQSCYWNYVRVLTPRSSHLISARVVNPESESKAGQAHPHASLPTPTTLLDTGVADDVATVAAFGGYLIVPRNTVGTVRFQYELPENLIQNQTYALKIQTQAGLGAERVTVRVQIPQGAVVRGASHSYTWRDKDVLEFEEVLYQDTTFKIYF